MGQTRLTQLMETPHLKKAGLRSPAGNSHPDFNDICYTTAGWQYGPARIIHD